MAIPFFVQLLAQDIDHGAIDLLYKSADLMLEQNRPDLCNSFIEEFMQFGEKYELSMGLHVALLTITFVKRTEMPNRIKLFSITQEKLLCKFEPGTVSRILHGLA